MVITSIPCRLDNDVFMSITKKETKKKLYKKLVKEKAKEFITLIILRQDSRVTH